MEGWYLGVVKYACRKNKGIHTAVTRLQSFMRQVTCNGQRPAWYLQMDIDNFLMSIDKPILLKILMPHIKNPDMRWLTEVLVQHDCTEDYLYKGRPGLLEQVPPHKSLRHIPKGKGLPIGNLNSQFFANVYLNKLDQFVKHQLKCSYFLRYCDDFVLLSDSREELESWRSQIEHFLLSELTLRLNTRREKCQPLSDGVDFLGYIVRRDYMLPRRRVVNQLRHALRDYQRKLVELRGDVIVYHFDTALLEQCKVVLASYWGHLLHADSFRLRQRLLTEFVFLKQYFVFSEDGGFTALFAVPKGFKTVRQQYYFYRWRFAGDVLLFQVGKFYEFDHHQDDMLALSLGLQRMRSNRRGARFGFPVFREDYYVKRVLLRGRAVLLIQETEGTCGKLRQRLPVSRMLI